MIKLENFDLDNILMDEKPHENILIYDISYKTLIDSKPLRIRLDKIDGFIRIYNGTRYLTLFGFKKYDAIYNRTRYLINLKSGITYIFRTVLWNSKLILMILCLKEILDLGKVIIHIKSVLNKDKDYYYHKIFLEKCSYHLTKK